LFLKYRFGESKDVDPVASLESFKVLKFSRLEIFRALKCYDPKGLFLVLAKCVRCPSGVVDGLRGKRKWPLLMALFSLLSSFFSLSGSVTFLTEGVDLGL
jgi:hypothetical protein